MKIQIIGYSGSGKSTLAKKLGKYYNIPVLHLDNVKFYGDWQERTFMEQSEIVKKFLEDNSSSWIIDGNYSKLARERFLQADIVIFLNYNRFYCYKMARRRYLDNKGKNRDSCPCIEKFDYEFKKWILFDGRTKKIKKQHLINLQSCRGKKYIFKNKKELERFLETDLLKIN